MKSAFEASGIFFGAMLVGLNLLSAADIFVVGRYEEKFGGQWDNFALGLQFSVPISLICSAGYLVALLLFRRRLGASGRRPVLIGGLAAGVVALVVSATGLVGRAAEVLPLGSIISLGVAFAALGLFLGLGSGASLVRMGRGKKSP